MNLKMVYSYRSPEHLYMSLVKYTQWGYLDCGESISDNCKKIFNILSKLNDDTQMYLINRLVDKSKDCIPYLDVHIISSAILNFIC